MGDAFAVAVVAVLAAVVAWSVGHALTIVQSGLPVSPEPKQGAPAVNAAEPSHPSAGDLWRAELAKIAQRDRAMEERAFLTRAKLVFEAVKRGWDADDMSEAAPLLSAGMVERFAIQLAMRKAAGRAGGFERYRVQSAQLVGASVDARFEAVHARLLARPPVDDGTVVDEIFTFLRRPTAFSREQVDLGRGTCPNCGAAVVSTDGTKCKACGSWLDSGEYDWLLTCERQNWAWTTWAAGRDIPGLSRAQQRDPELDPRILEDRALVAFWRWQEAYWKGDASALRVLASDAFMDGMARLDAGPLGPDPDAVSVELLSVGENGAGRQSASVLVRWAPDVSGAPRDTRETAFVFERAGEARTDRRAGLQCLRCPGCGAPPSSRDASRCAFCGRDRRGSEADWTLVAVDSPWSGGYS